jgi:hypothetical protein
MSCTDAWVTCELNVPANSLATIINELTPYTADIPTLRCANTNEQPV